MHTGNRNIHCLDYPSRAHTVLSTGYASYFSQFQEAKRHNGHNLQPPRTLWGRPMSGCLAQRASITSRSRSFCPL